MRRFSSLSVALLSLAWFLSPFPAHSQTDADLLETALASIRPRDRILLPVVDGDRIPLDGNTLPQALPALETGRLDGGQRLGSLLLVLRPDEDQQAALDTLTAAQQNPASPLYHQWLTPESYAEHFGASDTDIEQVRGWLERNGFQVEEVSANHQSLVFSGTVAQVEEAFQTGMHSYQVAGRRHIANASDPLIPAALAPVVAGVASLHDVFSAPQHTGLQHPALTSKPNLTSGSAHYLAPGDFATIYDVASLYNQAYDGTGETIAIVGRADISMSDIESFRSTFGLPVNNPVSIQTGSIDPGSTSSDDVDEAMLDTEWSGAVARKAKVDFVTSASTATTDGVFLSAQYIVNHNLAPILSVSYGLCESELGATANAFLNSLWQQAASQGITVLVSAGDSGAAGCDAASATAASHGRGVNGICSTPYSICVGGTEFNDSANPSLYWSATNSSTRSSALSYIPEKVWNESGSSGLWSTGGGVSTVYSKPSWQSGPGVPSDGKRDVPDVALTAAGHDCYLVGVWGALYGISGTSAAAPSFAGILALVAQKAETRLGNANPELYKLATAQRSTGGTAVFHDITSGNNSVPGVAGFTATAGYDQSTGLGSVDAEKLVTSWGTSSAAPAPAPTIALTLSSSSVAISRTGATVALQTAVSGLSSALSLSVGGLPSGLSASFRPASIAAPGNGSSVLTLTPGAALAPGQWTLTVTASDGGVSKTATLTAALPGLGISATPSASTLPRGGTLNITLHTTAAGGFNAALSFAVSGLPSGVSGKFSPASVAAPGSGTSTLTLTAAKTAALGAGKAQITVTGGGISGTQSISFSVAASSGNSRLHPL